MLNGLATQQQAVGICCAQKSHMAWNIEHQKPLHC